MEKLLSAKLVNQLHAGRQTHPGNQEPDTDPALNPDPLTHAPGSHPVGAGLGAVAGGTVGAAAAGAVMGTVLGPIGNAVGAMVGGLAGGLLGKEVAEQINPSAEYEHWEKAHASRPYIAAGTTFEHYAPAYQHGWESRIHHPGKSFNDIEPALGEDWEKNHGKSNLNWEHARPAARDAWERLDARAASTASSSPGIIAAGASAQRAAETTAQQTGEADNITHEMIETRAYYIFLADTGGEDEDWYRAERELKRI